MKYEDIEPLALLKIPEYWEKYLWMSGINPATVTITREEWATALYDIPWSDGSYKIEDDNQPRRLGATIVFDDLALLLVELLENGQTTRMNEILTWGEALAAINDPAITGCLWVTWGESFISNHVRHFPQLRTYLTDKPHLLNIIRSNRDRFRISDETRQLLDG